MEKQDSNDTKKTSSNLLKAHIRNEHKTLHAALVSLMERNAAHKSRCHSLAITKLQEAIHWLRADAEEAHFEWSEIR